jgi:trk system potassium uptake protein TrkA
MRLVFLGATQLAVTTAEHLIADGHEVIIIERDAEKIEELSGKLDCAFLHGDGSKPDVVEETDPAATDIFYCVTNHDQTNIIASLIAKNLGVSRVVTIVEDEDFVPICEHLGLTDTIIPVRTISRHLAGLVKAELRERNNNSGKG